MQELSRIEMVGRMLIEQNKSAPEIAKELNITISSVYSYSYQYKKKHNLIEQGKPKTYQVVGEMFFEQKMTREEIAEKMGVSVQAVYKNISKYKIENGMAKPREDQEDYIGEFKKEWDSVRFGINPNAKVN